MCTARVESGSWGRNSWGKNVESFLEMHEFAAQHGATPKNDFTTRFTRPFLVVVILRGNKLADGTAEIDAALARKTTSKGDKNADPNVIMTYVAHLEKSEEAQRGMPFSIGRDAANDIVVFHRSVSRRQAHISEESGTFYVVDVGSSYGTELDGKKLEPNKEHALNDGSIMVMADSVRCTFLSPDKLYELIQGYRKD
jgi:hypothetical protein